MGTKGKKRLYSYLASGLFFCVSVQGRRRQQRTTSAKVWIYPMLALCQLVNGRMGVKFKNVVFGLVSAWFSWRQYKHFTFCPNGIGSKWPKLRSFLTEKSKSVSFLSSSPSWIYLETSRRDIRACGFNRRDASWARLKSQLMPCRVSNKRSRAIPRPPNTTKIQPKAISIFGSFASSKLNKK